MIKSLRGVKRFNVSIVHLKFAIKLCCAINSVLISCLGFFSYCIYEYIDFNSVFSWYFKMEYRFFFRLLDMSLTSLIFKVHSSSKCNKYPWDLSKIWLCFDSTEKTTLYFFREIWRTLSKSLSTISCIPWGFQ